MAITPITSWRKSVYIAKFSSTTITEGEQIKVFATPIAYTMNVQPLSDDARIEMFGANAKKMFKAIPIPFSTDYDINEFDVAYLDDATPTGETIIGDNSNYIVKRVMKQNLIMTVYFESIKGK